MASRKRKRWTCCDAFDPEPQPDGGYRCRSCDAVQLGLGADYAHQAEDISSTAAPGADAGGGKRMYRRVEPFPYKPRSRAERAAECRGLLGLVALAYDAEEIIQAARDIGLIQDVEMPGGGTFTLVPPVGALRDREKDGQRIHRELAEAAEGRRDALRALRRRQAPSRPQERSPRRG